MLFSEERIERILGYKTWSDRQKIDDMYANLGINSPKKEKDAVRGNSKRIYRIIKQIDNQMGAQLLMHMDK